MPAVERIIAQLNQRRLRIGLQFDCLFHGRNRIAGAALSAVKIRQVRPRILAGAQRDRCQQFFLRFAARDSFRSSAPARARCALVLPGKLRTPCRSPPVHPDCARALAARPPALTHAANSSERLLNTVSAGSGAVAQSTGKRWISASVCGVRRTNTADTSSR